ncbi:MAG: hypothetical protein WEA34_09405 [Gemmatimonadota bacterium]
MTARLSLLLLCVSVPTLAGTVVHARHAPPGETVVVADTILRPELDRAPAAVATGLSAVPGEPHVRLGLRRIPVSVQGVGRREGARLIGGPAVQPDPWLSDVLRRRVATFGPPVPDTARFLPPAPAPAPRLLPADDDRFVTDFADLAMRVRSRMELGGDWARFEPCDVQFKASCTSSIIPQLSPEFLFGVQLDGTIAERVRVDVDFDQAREFDAANRINIFYEGGEDDILRRLEVGDVTFRLPRSRFLTEGLPAGNFGFQAEGQFGPVDFQTVWAQQRGDLNSRVFQLSGIGDQRGFVQQDTLVLDDADYARGQFFFLFDPSAIDGYPHVDVLSLDPASAPADVAPGNSPVQLYRFENDAVLQSQVEGFIQADAVAETATDTVREAGWFRYLQPGVDYYVHPSGLWVALRTPLRPEEMLAVTYVTAVGDTVGDYNPERIANRGERPTLRLLKASGANHRPGLPTWDLEMHQIYRVSGSPDVDQSSVDLTVSIGELAQGRTFKRRPSGEGLTFLRLFGLDEEAPLDRIDPSFVYQPGGDLFSLADNDPVQGTFVVFPTLRPFAEPPPIPSLGLTEGQVSAILSDDANPRIYEDEDPFERENAGRFRLTIAYRLESTGVISSFSLGAFGIREGSERITLGDRVLTRGLDYEIDYDVGQVVLLDADALFATDPTAAVRASWEQRSLFEVSPTQVFGFRTHTDLGDSGGFDVLGLYRSERSVVRRPVLGTEPGAALLGGVTATYGTTLSWMDRVLDVVPGLRLEGVTSLDIDGELAVSMPNPNTDGRAFVDDFDAAQALPVSLVASSWNLGSAPTFQDGAEGVLPGVLDATTAAPMTWQTQWIVEGPGGDSLGIHEGYFAREDIDRQIRVAGAETREQGLLLDLDGPLGGGPLGWRSITTGLSTQGLDLTRTEFLEVYVAAGDDVRLVFDLGTVSEDAFFVDANGNTTGTRAGGRPWGLGILDQEADPARGELWNDAADELGVWAESCVAERGRIYRIGDPRSVCTRGNGRPDSEDLDQDGILDTPERHLRYVLNLDGTSPYLARSAGETGSPHGFELYRIPIRDGGIEVGGAVGDADLRSVRHLRITAAGPAGRQVRLARMRLVGSRWIKRGGEGVFAGIGGDTLGVAGRVEVSAVSRLTEGAAYNSPPGVLEELIDPTSAFAGQGIEFNEKSLGLAFDDLAPGSRAEVYQRFPQRPRSFLSYRQARLWVVAREGDFGPERPHSFFFKVGNDPDNFYLYRTRLPGSGTSGTVEPADWLPEVRVQFEAWFALRQRAEEILLDDPRGPGDPAVMVWSADSTYAVSLKDRGRAPNLAAVRELSLGVWNEGDAPISGEVWIDELRLGDPVRTAGVAGSVDVVLDGGGALNTRLSVTNRGADFRQLRQEASFQTDRSIDLRSTLALDRMMPSGWGVEVPVTLDVNRTSQAPRFLEGSDLRAGRLVDLRETASRRTRLGVAFRRRTPAADPLAGFFVDGLSARAAYTRSSGSTIASRYSSRGTDAGVAWAREPAPREVDLVPGFAKDFLRGLLPGFLEDRVVDTPLRLTPERISLGASYLRQDDRIFRFERIVERPDDPGTLPTLVPRESLESVADVRLRPIPPLRAEVTFASERDLLGADDAVNDPAVQALLRRQRATPGGVDLGWETERTIRTRLGFTPELFSFFRNDFDWTTTYRSDRSANLLARSVTEGDTTLALARDARGQRDWGVSLALDPGQFARSWLGEPAPEEPADLAQLRSMLGALRPLTAAYRDGVTSRFSREAVDPGFGYQVGWAGQESYRVIEGDTAAIWTDRQSWTLGTGLNLPRAASLQVGYSIIDATTLDVRSDRRLHQRTWPNIQTRLPSVGLPEFTGMRTLTLTSGIQRTVRHIEFGGISTRRSEDEDVRVPFDLTLQWLGTLVTAYQGAVRTGRGVDPTGDTELEEVTHRLSVRSRWDPVGPLAGRLDRPIDLSILAGYVSERSCRITRAGEECVAFVDQIRRTLSVSVDTSVGDFQVGMQLSFDDRQSFVGLQTGSTQLQLGVFGQLEFSAGSFPTP